MNGMDRDLGMGRPIGRRDFVNGSAVALGASLLPKWSWALALDAQAAGQGSGRRPLPAAPHRHARQPRGVVRGRAPDCATAGAVDLAGAAHTGETLRPGRGRRRVERAGRGLLLRGQRRPRRAGAGARQPRRLRRPRQAQRVRRRRQAAGAERRHAQHRVAAALQPAVAAAAGRDRRRPRSLRQRTTRPTAASTPALGLRSGHFFDKETWGSDGWPCGRPAAAAAAASRPSTSS